MKVKISQGTFRLSEKYERDKNSFCIHDLDAGNNAWQVSAANWQSKKIKSVSPYGSSIQRVRIYHTKEAIRFAYAITHARNTETPQDYSLRCFFYIMYSLLLSGR